MSPSLAPPPAPSLIEQRRSGAHTTGMMLRARRRGSSGHGPRLAREHLAGYDTGPSDTATDTAVPGERAASDRVVDHAATGDTRGAGTDRPEAPPHPVDDAAWRYLHELDDPRPGEGTPPFGLPILAEIPGLATVLEQLREADRLIARALEGILLLQDHADVIGCTGVSLETWVTTVARRTRTDARMLLSAAEMVRRLPTLRAGFQEGRLSWAQVRAVALKARPLPRSLDDRIDQAVADALDGVGGAEPDALTRVITWSLATLQPQTQEREERRDEEREFLGMQPRLDGTGGRLWGEFSATSWAVLDAALNTVVTADRDRRTGGDNDGRAGATPSGSDRRGADRAARLVELLDQSLAGTSDADSEPGNEPRDEPGSEPGNDAGSHADSDAETASDDPEAGTPPPAPPSSRSRPQLLLRADLDALLDRSQTPGTLLTSMLGGHVRVSAPTARRLIDARGADLRTVILDDTGSVVGVGRRVRIAPGWLRDAALAVHDTCSAPGCAAPARTSQIDHARPWQPARPDDLPGSTDISELAPMCAEHNHHKERDGWTVHQSTDGRRTWTHRRSGLTTRTIPATWRPRAGTPPAVPDEPSG